MKLLLLGFNFLIYKQKLSLLMSSLGTPGSATYSQSLSGIEEMMNVLPNNTANQINARNVRDVVLTLYDDIQGLSSSISSTSSVTYTNLNPSSITVGGISTGSTFNNKTVQQIFDDMFYPYIAPTTSISVSPSVLEYGDSSTTLTAAWSIEAKKNNITSSTIRRPIGSISVATPLSNTNASGNVSSGISSPSSYNTQTFTFSVYDGSTTVVKTTSSSWGLRRYWGTVASGHTLSITSTASVLYSDISSLSSDISSSYIQTRSITTNNDYVVFIWPTQSVDLSVTPAKCVIAGLGNTDWTKTRSSIVLTNQFGYTASYDVWRFNYIQSSNTFTYVLS